MGIFVSPRSREPRVIALTALVLVACMSLIISGCDSRNTGRTIRRSKRPDTYRPALPGVSEGLAAVACTDTGGPGTPSIRPLSNSEYLNAVSDLIGDTAPRSSIAMWNPTPTAFGFEGLAWAAFDRKMAEDRVGSAEILAELALGSSRVMRCVPTPGGDPWNECAGPIVLGFAERAYRRPLTPPQIALLKGVFDAEFARNQARIARTAPVGAHDTSSNLLVSGWAVDPSWQERPVEIHFYVDGPAGGGGVFAGAAIADQPRADVNAATGYVGNHGFLYRLPDRFADGLPHTVYAHAIGGGTNPVLPPSLIVSRNFQSSVPSTATPVSTYRPIWFTEGVRLALTTVLASPNFLFKFELPSPGLAIRPLDDFELASRLSFFILGSIPDDELLAAARAGQLRDPSTLAAQANRLLTQHADRFTWNFAGQWLGFRKLATGSADPLDQAFANESMLVFREVLQAGLPVSALLDPGFSFLNRQLASHYGIGGVDSDGFVKTPVSGRGGITRQGSFLKSTSSPANTSPVKRGIWVLEKMLCRPMEVPSGEILAQIEAAKRGADPNAPVHVRLEVHRNKASTCFNCHKVMDPIGLSLENYDSLGRWRASYSDGKPVVADGEIDGAAFSGPDGMVSFLKSRPDFNYCVAEKLATFAFSHGISEADKCGIWKIAHAAPGSSEPATIRDLVLRIVTSDRFLSVRHGSGNGS